MQSFFRGAADVDLLGRRRALPRRGSLYAGAAGAGNGRVHRLAARRRLLPQPVIFTVVGDLPPVASPGRRWNHCDCRSLEPRRTTPGDGAVDTVGCGNDDLFRPARDSTKPLYYATGAMPRHAAGSSRIMRTVGTLADQLAGGSNLCRRLAGAVHERPGRAQRTGVAGKHDRNLAGTGVLYRRRTGTWACQGIAVGGLGGAGAALAVAPSRAGCAVGPNAMAAGIATNRPGL